jgi:uncharacterized protein (DUF2252 family)
MATAKKSSAKPETGTVEAQAPVFLSRAERLAAGHALRDSVPREGHRDWIPAADGRDPIALLEKSNEGRVQELVPIRYGRMLHSPFTFLRGSAGLMAYDLAAAPNTGLRVQACGDCHLSNFGLFATPERNLVFDLNDFDETLPAPWEWDIKRLAISFAVAARGNNQSDAHAREAAMVCVRSYRERLREYSRMTPLEVWYAHLDVEALIAMASDEKSKKAREELAKKARGHVADQLYPKIVSEEGGKHRFIDEPPRIFHSDERDLRERGLEALAEYRHTLSDERRVLLDRFRLDDIAVKIVGIGSVGTRCFISLFTDEEGHPLILQFKEAGRSVLEPYAGRSRYEEQGQRVVVGQRLMQASSDIFLGWARGARGYDFYGRQLRDMKMSVPIEGMTAVHLKCYATYCGWTLARAHARAGDATTISGYLGKCDAFDQAIGAYATAYADQTERDYAALVKAVSSGRIKALIEEE